MPCPALPAAEVADRHLKQQQATTLGLDSAMICAAGRNLLVPLLHCGVAGGNWCPTRIAVPPALICTTALQGMRRWQSSCCNAGLCAIPTPLTAIAATVSLCMGGSFNDMDCHCLAGVSPFEAHAA